MRERFRNWMRTPSLRGQLIWLSVSSVLVTLLISLLILVLLISNVMGPFVNREAEFAMQTVSRSLSTKTQLLEDILLRICKSPQMTGEASDARGEQFRSLVDIYSDKNIVAPGLPFVEMAYFMDMRGAFDVVSYHEPKEIRQVISQETIWRAIVPFRRAARTCSALRANHICTLSLLFTTAGRTRSAR